MKSFPFLAVALAIAAAAEPPWDWGDTRDDWNSSPGFESSKALCRKLRDREPPESDRPDAAVAASLRGCDSEALYYGIGRPADPVRARQCAFLEAERDDAGVFSGRTMLMTIYANGRGANRDLDVATHLACGIEGAPMESHGRVTHLAELKAKGWKGQDFHFCDDITSGLAMGYCASHDATIAGALRDAALAAMASGWSVAEKQAFARLRAAHNAYVEAHGDGEVDMRGTARGRWRSRPRNRFAGSWSKCSSGSAPAAPCRRPRPGSRPRMPRSTPPIEGASGRRRRRRASFRAPSLRKGYARPSGRGFATATPSWPSPL